MESVLKLMGFVLIAVNICVTAVCRAMLSISLNIQLKVGMKCP
jgi:hypothetical protein